MGQVNLTGETPRFFYGYIVALAAFIIMATIYGTVYSFGVFLKPLQTAFGWSKAATSGAYSLTFLLNGILIVIAGKINDRFGPRWLITVTGISLGAGYLLLSQMEAIWQLYLFFGVLGGIGFSGGFVPLTSTIAKWFVKRRALMTGLVLAGIGVGTMTIPALSSWLISSLGWRTAYLVFGIAVITIILPAAYFLKRDPSQVGMSPYGKDETKNSVSDVGALGFSFSEAIHTKQFWMLGIIFFCFGLCLQATMAHIVAHAMELGFAATTAASILAIIGGAGIAGRIMIGFAGDRLGTNPAALICFSLLSVSFFLLLPGKEIWMLYLFATVFGFSYGGYTALQSPIVADLFGLKAHGLILASTNIGAVVGFSVGPVLAGKIFDELGSYFTVFIICATASVLSILLTSLIRLPVKPNLPEANNT